MRHTISILCGVCIFMACLLFQMGSFLPATAQSSNTLRTEKGMIATTQDTTAINKLITVADTISKHYPDSGRKLMHLAIIQSRSIGYEKGMLLGNAKIGVALYNSGSWDSSLTYYLRALAYTSNPALYKNYGAILYNTIGSCYENGQKHATALQYYEKALAALGTGSRTNLTTDSMGVYANIGVIWLALKNNKVAREYFEITRKLAERSDNAVRLATACHNIAASYNNQDSLDLAETWYLKALALERKHGLGESEVITASNLGIIAGKKKKHAEALDYMRQVFAIPGFQHFPQRCQLQASLSLGQIYLRMKNYKLARRIILKTYREAQMADNHEMMANLYGSMATLYKAEGNHREAYKYIKLYEEKQDALINREMTMFLDVWAEAQMAAKDKSMLAQQLHITQQKSQLQQKNFVIAAVVLSALLLLSIIFVLVRNREHKQAIIYQLQQSGEIDQLKAQMRGEEQERQRIAHELHDGIASQLWGIRLNVDNLQQLLDKNDGHGVQLGAIYQQLTVASQDVRKTAHNLMPDLLLDEGLATALASVCEMTRKNTKLEVDFLEYGVIPQMNQDIELSIYRMVQELIQNVLKHAVGATCLLVQISCVGTLLSITVEDNGRSFNSMEKSEGVGLQQIRKRTLTLKGRFELESITGKGTSVYLEFDLQHLL